MGDLLVLNGDGVLRINGLVSSPLFLSCEQVLLNINHDHLISCFIEFSPKSGDDWFVDFVNRACD